MIKNFLNYKKNAKTHKPLLPCAYGTHLEPQSCVCAFDFTLFAHITEYCLKSKPKYDCLNAMFTKNIKECYTGF